MDKTKEFLKKGYLPIQLPPGFSSDSFANAYKKLGNRWEECGNHSRCRPEKFSVARSSYNRRTTSIVNPIAFYFLVREIVRYWKEIQNHYNKSSISLSRPKLKPSIRAIEISKFSDLYEAKVTKSTGYKFALLTDISRFFPTIYTHTIPWALHSKEIAKKHTKQKTPEYFGNILDSKSMGIQEWQTMGLPIGPDTSHVIAEIIATSIDQELKRRLGYMPHGFRYVDDYCFFFNNKEDAEHALTELIKALGVYELQINADKTKIVTVKDLVEDSWKYSIKHLDISDEVYKQRNDIHKYFESLFSLENKYTDESLIKYGLKKISTVIVKRQNWDIYEAYLLKCGYSFPNTLQVITSILSTYHYYKYPLKMEAISNFCNSLINTHSLSDGHSEIAWTLWLAKELKINISKKSIRAVESVSSSVCLLLALDLFYSGLTKTKPLKSTLQKFCNKDSLYNENWLLAYEAGKRFWLFNKDRLYIENDKFFKDLLDFNVSFYSEAKSCNRVFQLKSTLEEGFDADLFESDEDIDIYFEFEEGDEEYFDSSNNEDIYEHGIPI